MVLRSEARRAFVVAWILARQYEKSPMATSKRYNVSGDPVIDRIIGGFGTQPLDEPLKEEVREPPKEVVWSIRRTVWFVIGLSAVGWTAVVGLVVYLFSVQS